MPANLFFGGCTSHFRHLIGFFVLLPLSLLYVLYSKIIIYIGEKFSFLSKLITFVPVKEVFHTLIPAALILGVGIGFLGSRITIRKHLKV